MEDVVVEASPYARAQNNLATLKLDQMAAALPDYMRMVSGGEMEFVSALAEMTAAEVLARKRRILSQRIRSSGLPCVKTLADFDWSFQPSVPRSRIEGLGRRVRRRGRGERHRRQGVPPLQHGEDHWKVLPAQGPAGREEKGAVSASAQRRNRRRHVGACGAFTLARLARSIGKSGTNYIDINSPCRWPCARTPRGPGASRRRSGRARDGTGGNRKSSA